MLLCTYKIVLIYILFMHKQEINKFQWHRSKKRCQIKKKTKDWQNFSIVISINIAINAITCYH